MATYNGHKNWAQWNVALWINNDENLYHMARKHMRQEHTKQQAAQAMMDELDSLGIKWTTDGAKYSVTAIRAAMVGI